MAESAVRPQPDEHMQLPVGSLVLPNLMDYEDIEEDETNTASVPEDDVARLMYYMNCMSLLKDSSKEPLMEKLRDYRNYQKIKDSRDELKQLLTAVNMTNPTFLTDKRFMKVAQTGLINKDPCRLVQRKQEGQTQLDGAPVSHAEETDDRFLFCTNQWISDYHDEPKRKIEMNIIVSDAIKEERESASKKEEAAKAMLEENARMKERQEEDKATEQRARGEAKKEFEAELKVIEEQLAKDREQELERQKIKDREQELERQKIEPGRRREQNARKKCKIS